MASGDAPASLRSMLSPVELEIELFCRGNPDRRVLRGRRGRPADLAHARRARVRTGARDSGSPQADLGQRPGRRALRRRVHRSVSSKSGEAYEVLDDRAAATAIRFRSRRSPPGTRGRTSSGVEMSRIGVLQGNYLGVYVSNRCLYWASTPSLACKFCTTGKNLGVVGAGAQEGRGRRRGGAGGPRRVGLDLHAPEHGLSLRGSGQARSRSTACGSASRS